MNRPSHFWFFPPVLVACLCVSCKKGITEERQAVLITIAVESPGFRVDQVNDEVIRPMAIALNGVEGMQKIRSRATSGRAVVWVDFAPGTDRYKARQVLAERLQRVAPQLPAGVVPILTPEVVPDEIMLIALWFKGEASKASGRQARDLRLLADEVVRQRLETITGVAEVVITGGLVEQCQVIVSQDSLTRLALTIPNLVSSMEKALGEGKPRRGKGSEFVVTRGPNEDTLGEIVVAARGNNPIRLKDIAEVRIGAVSPHPDQLRPKREVKTSPQPGVLLGVLRVPGTNAKRLSRELDAALESLKPSLPPGLYLSRKLPPEFTPLASGLEKEIQRDQPPEVSFKQETSAELGTVLMRRSPPRYTIAIAGPDREHLRNVGSELAHQLGQVAGVADVQVDSLEETQQIEINIDHKEAARFDMAIEDITAPLELALEGRKVGRLKDSRTGRAIDVVLIFGRNMQNDAESLRKLTLTTGTGKTVTLGQLAIIKRVSVPRSLIQWQMKRAILISCDVPTSGRARVFADIKRVISNQKLKAGHIVEENW
jgi:Cu/Ag efflux pump CusA